MAEQSERVLSELGRISTFFPILSMLGNRWAARRPWDDRRIALHLHLTTLSAALVREIVLGGGTWVVSAANPATTDPGVVDYLRGMGVTVYADGREDGIAESVRFAPDLFGDVGFALGEALVRARARPRGGVEITRSGVTRLRKLELAFPVLNIDEGQLKPAIENRHGVGEGLWQSFTQLTGMHLAGRRVAVIGYGPVGAGVAAYARAGGAVVTVVEIDPIRRLQAHYDGFATPLLSEAISTSQILVAAAGVRHALDLATLYQARDGAVLINAGHGADEIDVAGLRQVASGVDHVGARVVRYRLPSGRHVVLLADGNPLNIVLNSGSQEPVLLHFAVLGLALEWMARNEVPAGEIALPVEIEREAAEVALGVLG